MKGALAFGGVGVAMPALVVVAWAALGLLALALPRGARQQAPARIAPATA